MAILTLPLLSSGRKLRCSCSAESNQFYCGSLGKLSKRLYSLSKDGDSPNLIRRSIGGHRKILMG